MLPRDDDDDDDEERTATRDETFMPEFSLLRPRQTGNERMPMPTTHGELDEEAVATAAICLLGAAIAPATPASTTIAIATPKPSIPVSVSLSLLLSLPPLAPFTRIGKTHNSIGIRQGQNQWVDLSMAKTATGGSRGEQRKTSLPSPWLWRPPPSVAMAFIP